MYLIVNYLIYFIELIENFMIWNGEFLKYYCKIGWKVGEKEKDYRLGSKGSEYF